MLLNYPDRKILYRIKLSHIIYPNLLLGPDLSAQIIFFLKFLKNVFYDVPIKIFYLNTFGNNNYPFLKL